MLEIRVIHEWRPGHADPLARIEEGLKLMNDIASRLEISVTALAAAIDNQNASIAEVATAIRNHPASTTDSGRLSSLADRLDGITASLNNSTASLHSLASEEAAEDAGAPVDPPAEPAPVDAGAGSDTSSPPAGADDGSAGAGGDAGSSPDTIDGPVDETPAGDPGTADTASGDGFEHAE